MIKVIVKTNTIRARDIVTEATNTPASVFDELGVGTAGSMVNLNGGMLTAADLHSTFADLGVEDGTTVNLNSITKADGAR